MTELRLELIHDLLHQKAATARTFVQYIDTDREYIEGDKLYMREAHFVMTIGPGEGRTMSEIAQIMDVTQGAVSQTAARLEKKGYICRKKCSTNRRQTIAVLTEKGMHFYEEHQKYDTQTFLDANQLYFHQFTDDELRMLINYEKTMQALLSGAYNSSDAE